MELDATEPNGAAAARTCCTAGRIEHGLRANEAAAQGAVGDLGRGRHGVAQVLVPAGTFVMGDSRRDGRAADGETPLHRVSVAAFEMDATSVTRADFEAFVRSSGYVTRAERLGTAAVPRFLLTGDAAQAVGHSATAPWWAEVAGADWRNPWGPGSGAGIGPDHPVVQVDWFDAQAYCRWAGRRLPSEDEWEYAARGGLERRRYPWGDDLRPQGEWNCNIWQGDFPARNTGEDGWLATAPVRTYAPNGFGLWQMVGNVWEWCVDHFSASYYRESPELNPCGPGSGSQRVLRGGSFMCHDSYCNRYRNAARTGNTPDSASANVGFRTVGP